VTTPDIPLDELDEADEFSSPACSMHEVSDVYMGYADKADLVAFLDELLQASRALQIIEQDEARCCSTLLLHIRNLGGESSSKIDETHGKAMAITGLGERLIFLNGRQDWFVKRLREMLPRVRDRVLHSDLAAMLRARERHCS
jgi:Domain of unknown function (DUF6306)